MGLPNNTSRKYTGIMTRTTRSIGASGGSRRVFGQFAWLEVGSGKVVLSRPIHQLLTTFLAKQSFQIPSAIGVK